MSDDQNEAEVEIHDRPPEPEIKPGKKLDRLVAKTVYCAQEFYGNQLRDEDLPVDLVLYVVRQMLHSKKCPEELEETIAFRVVKSLARKYRDLTEDWDERATELVHNLRAQLRTHKRAYRDGGRCVIC